MKTVLVIGGEKDFCDSLLASFNEMGYHKAEEEQPVDILTCIIDPPHCDFNEYEKLLEGYETTALGLLQEISTLISRMEGGGKRLCFITRLSSSINLADSANKDSDFGQTIAAASNMMIKILFNRLRPLEYTFRVYCSDTFCQEECSYISEYFIRNRSFEEEAFTHSDENRLVMRDKFEREYTW